jgi:hypothetical protein
MSTPSMDKILPNLAATTLLALLFASFPVAADKQSSTSADPTVVAADSTLVKTDAASDGVSRADTVILQQESWTRLLSIRIENPPGKTLFCVASGSADVVNPGNCDPDPQVPVPLLYLFTLTRDALNPQLDGGAERTVEFSNMDCPFGADVRAKALSTTRFLMVPPGSHKIHFLGRPQPGSLTAAVDDASLTVVCTDRRLP